MLLRGLSHSPEPVSGFAECDVESNIGQITRPDYFSIGGTSQGHEQVFHRWKVEIVCDSTSFLESCHDISMYWTVEEPIEPNLMMSDLLLIQSFYKISHR